MLVLVVDDSPTIRTIMKACLQKKEYKEKKVCNRKQEKKRSSQ